MPTDSPVEPFVSPELDDITKLLILADACSDVIYGGDRGWERCNFKEFVRDVRRMLVFGLRCKNDGYVPKERPHPPTGADSTSESLG